MPGRPAPHSIYGGDSRPAQVEVQDEARRIGLLLGGDVLLDLEPGVILSAEGPDAVLGGWAELRRMDGVDVGLANLECALTTRGVPLAGKKYLFRADPTLAAPALDYLGFDAVSLANNHVLDFGHVGLADTLAALREAGVAGVGAGADQAEAYAPALLDISGVRVALLAFGGTEFLPEQYRAWWSAAEGEPGIATLEPQDRLLAAVSAARAGAHVVVVSLHWGVEYGDVTPGQRQLARAVIEAGADIVFGHHPHVFQPVEFHRGRPILYSLGNLAFHSGQPAARQMVVAEVQLKLGASGGASDVEVRLHALSNDGGRSVRMEPTQAAAYLAQIGERCVRLGAHAAFDADVLVLTPN